MTVAVFRQPEIVYTDEGKGYIEKQNDTHDVVRRRSTETEIVDLSRGRKVTHLVVENDTIRSH